MPGQRQRSAPALPLQFLYLNTRAHKDKEFEKPDAKRLLSMTELDELDEKDRETRFGAAMCALSIFRCDLTQGSAAEAAVDS